MPYPMSDPTAWYECWPHVSPFSEESIGKEMDVRALGINAATSAVYPASSVAIYVPFRLARPTTFSGMYTVNGATAADSIDVGLYTGDGRRLASKGLTLQSGTGALQSLAFPATVAAGPGIFYMAICMNGTTGTLFRSNISNIQLQGFGCSQEDLSGAGTPGTLPASATFAAIAQSYLPLFGLVRSDTTI